MNIVLNMPILMELDLLSVSKPAFRCKNGQGDTNSHLAKDWQDASELVDLVNNAEFESVLTHPFSQRLFSINDESVSTGDLEALLEKEIDILLQQEDEDIKHARAISTLAVGISFLQLFVQNNWVGPPSQQTPETLLPQLLSQFKDEQCLRDYASNALIIDGEPVYNQATHLIFLFFAKTVFLNCRELLRKCQTAQWWLMRCLQIHQALLNERSPTLKATILQIIEEVQKIEPIMTDDRYSDWAIQFHLEAGHLCYFYYEMSAASEHFIRAKKRTGLQVELTGLLGKRTRFQEKEVSQLVLKVERMSGEDNQTGCEKNLTVSVPDPCHTLPKNVALDDETVLENIEFTKPAEVQSTSVSPVEQAMIFGLCHQHRKMHEGQGKIVEEEILAYLTRLMSEPQNWCIQSVSLLTRARWECGSSRRIQRSVMQLEELVNQFSRRDPPAMSRLPLLFSSSLPPKWIVEKELGTLLMSLGATKAALEVYERLQMWEDVIKCYHQLGRKEKAERLIREQLSIKETATLWCYLGDVCKNPEHYQKAWELSNGRSSRAQRSLGYHHLSQGEFDKCISCFEKSLQVNGLQVGVWFSYGCACLANKKYDLAAKGFRRCVNLDSDNFEAWNNLATAYIKNSQKPRAFLSLQEAIKCNYENWKVWENYLLVGIDCGEFEEAIRAYHRLLDLKEKHTDTEVLRILVRAVNEDIQDANDRPGSHVRNKLLELFGRLTSKVTNSEEIWTSYAELLFGSDNLSLTDSERALQFLQKAHRLSIQVENWQKEVSKCLTVAGQASKLADRYLELSEKVEDSAKAVQLLSSAKLMLRGIIVKIKKQHADPMTQQIGEPLAEVCTEMEGKLQVVTDVISQRNS